MDIRHATMWHAVGHFCPSGAFPLSPIRLGARRLSPPITAAALKHDIFVETPLPRPERHLAPFPRAGSDVPRLFHNRRDHDLTPRLNRLMAVVIDKPGAERIAPR